MFGKATKKTNGKQKRKTTTTNRAARAARTLVLEFFDEVYQMTT